MQSITKIPNNIRALLCASNQINSYLKAVQELVYNALDADATSIAIRIHIDNGTIQVIDNGCGIIKKDFKLLGQNNTTSKIIDASTLKSMPNKYGYRGQSLANLIQVSKCVKITSRHNKTEATFVKVFECGKEKLINETNTRPSKGTTGKPEKLLIQIVSLKNGLGTVLKTCGSLFDLKIDVKGFLPILNIQKRNIDSSVELSNIKTFLEQTSLVHFNVSVSVRDDSTNEIIYKLHKNKDIYQTLLNLYDIDKSYVQEFQVEKNSYKVTAFIAKQNKDVRKHFVFLNGRLVPDSSKLHKTITHNLNKLNKTRTSNRAKIKKCYQQDEDYEIIDIPFYFIFIKCPYIDYELNNTVKPTVLEFKDWKQINKLLEKLICFYNGDICVKEITKTKKVDNIYNSDTRDQVKKIVNKILGSKYKSPAALQMHNGIKGKKVKRKRLKKNALQVSLSKIIKPIELTSIGEENIHSITMSHKANKITDPHSGNQNKNINLRKTYSIRNKCDKKQSPLLNKNKTIKPFNNDKHNDKTKKLNKSNIHICNKKKSHYDDKKTLNKICKTNKRPKEMSLRSNFIFERDSVKQRCLALAKETKKQLDCERQKLKNRLFKKTIQYSNFTKDNKNISVRKQVDEFIIHELKTIPRKQGLQNIQKDDERKTHLATTYNLLKSVINSQEVNDWKAIDPKNYQKILTHRQVNPIKNQVPKPYRTSVTPMITFQSHNYEIHNLQEENLSHNSLVINSNYEAEHTYRSMNNFFQDCFKKPKRFISKKSIDDFAPSNKQKIFQKNLKSKIKQNVLLKKSFKRIYDSKNLMKDSIEHSYTIEFSHSNHYKGNNCKVNNLYQSEFIPFVNTEHLTTAYSPNHSPTYVEQSDYEHISFINNLFQINHNFNNNQEGYQTMKTITESNSDKESWERDIYSNENENTAKDTNNSNVLNVELNINESPKIYATYSVLAEGNELVENSEIINITDTNGEDRFISSLVMDNNSMNVPTEVCKTITNSHELFIKEFETSFNIINDSMYVESDCNLNLILNNAMNDKNNIFGEIADACKEKDIYDVMSHNFTASNDLEINEKVNTMNNSESREQYQRPTENAIFAKHSQNDTKKSNVITENQKDFILGNRLGFVPKGMSQIFATSHSKADCLVAIDDYYEDRIYNEFANKVQNTVEVFEPRIQEASDFVTKDIDRVNVRLKKDTASLKFNGELLKNAKVLGQVDEKFIAAVIEGKSNNSELSEFLVLFDQHAVHERIRLENNMNDYLKETQWKSVTLDKFVIKLSKDDIKFLHNFKEKFNKFGLEWTILNNNEITISGIPEAILSKNPRPVDKVIRAIQSLITEVINNIKLQGGCVSMYPKSIMNLVFSEACRYAIKFGDHLTRNECAQLLKQLSDCKTPFQCAHGRPVMAVIMDVKPSHLSSYRVNKEKLMKFNKKL